MPTPRFEEPTEAPDGVRTLFTLPTAYVAGSVVAFFHRGLPRAAANLDGFSETDPAAGTVTTTEAPLEDDHVAFLYLEPTPAPGEQFIEIGGEVVVGEVSGVVEQQLLDGGVRGESFGAESLPLVEVNGTIIPAEIEGQVLEC